MSSSMGMCRFSLGQPAGNRHQRRLRPVDFDWMAAARIAMRNLAVLLLMFAACASVARAEAAQTSTSFLGKLFGKQENFADLNRQRRTHLTEIGALERDIRALESQLEQLNRELEKAPDELRYIASQIPGLDAAIKEKERLEATGRARAPQLPPYQVGRVISYAEHLATQPLQSLKDQKAQLERRQQELTEKSGRLPSLTAELKKKRDDIEQKRASIAELEERIGIALNIETEKYFYRSIVSLIFASIVFFLVYRFFSVVDSDDAVRKSIFSGDAGIQFITLFSIVIAVILFGILEILGSNELSALLGGLSGYILGKHNKTAAPAVTPTPGAPATGAAGKSPGKGAETS